MRPLIKVPLIPYPPGASAQVRTELYFQWCEQFQEANPSRMLPFGVKKRWWHFFTREHPFTTQHQRPKSTDSLSKLYLFDITDFGCRKTILVAHRTKSREVAIKMVLHLFPVGTLVHSTCIGAIDTTRSPGVWVIGENPQYQDRSSIET